MEQKPSAGPSVPAQHEHRLAASVLRFDLGADAAQLRLQDSYRDGSPAGRTLVKEPDLRIVLFALKAGARLEKHRASGPISVHVLEGNIRLDLGTQSVNLQAGELLMLEPQVPHDVEALEDALFLLTIGRTKYRDVSDQHEPRV